MTALPTTQKTVRGRLVLSRGETILITPNNYNVLIADTWQEPLKYFIGELVEIDCELIEISRIPQEIEQVYSCVFLEEGC